MNRPRPHTDDTLSGTDENRPVIAMDRVSKIYHPETFFFAKRKKEVVALNRVSFQIHPGEIFGLVGESGSGKTTAGRLIVKLEQPDHGDLLFHGSDLTTLKGAALAEFRSRVQMIFQDPYQSLNPHLSILDSIAEPMIINRPENRKKRYEKTIQALQFVGLTPPETFIHRYPHQLSGGQRQRVAIARAMILEPEFIVADEPTSMLDAPIKLQIFAILKSLREAFGTAILFITHSMPAARYLCDRIAVIYRGRIMEVGPTPEIMHRPCHPYTKALMDAVPHFGRLSDQRHNTLRRHPRREITGNHCPFFTRCNQAVPGTCDRNRPELTAVRQDHLTACFFPQPKPAK